MKKFLKFAAYAAGALVVMIGGATAFVVVRSNGKINRPYVVAVRPVRIPTNVAAVARGRHIAVTRGCVDCHGADFAGAKVIDDGAMGRLHGSNLTRGAGSRVATFKDED